MSGSPEWPADPLAAVTHPDPYPYYAELVAHRPIHRDERLGLWVASGASAVKAVLTSDLCRVRPPAEPVPKSLLDSPAADIFGHLIRMNDGPRHLPVKLAVSATLAFLEPARIVAASREQARLLAEEIEPAAHPDRLVDFAFRLPVHVMGGLLGIKPAMLPEIAGWVSDFVRCLAPGGTAEQLDRGKAAAGHLQRAFKSLLGAGEPGRAPTLLSGLSQNARRADPDVIVANGIGFLSQAYEATAGLIGNTLVALGRHPEARRTIDANPALMGRAVGEVVRYDSPVQNTRRFLAGAGIVAGQEMTDGDSVLVVLAAANRDPSANAEPDRFDMARRERQVYTFGAGLHTCPGEAIATAIAQAGVERLLASGCEPERLAGAVTYRASANTRVPLFGERA